MFKDYFPPSRGGVEQHIHEVVGALEGVEFTVLTSSRHRRQVIDYDRGVRIIRAPELFRPVSTPVTPSWVRHLRNTPADVIHAHMPNPFGELCILAAHAPAPLVATYHADIIGRRALMPFFAPFQQRFLKKARRIVVTNPRVVDRSKVLGPHRAKAVVIPFGVDAAYWSERPYGAAALSEAYPGKIILFLGRLAYYKGLDVLLHAMRGVDATCLIVGEGPMKASLQQLAKDLGLPGRVVFVGSVEDEKRRDYFHAADLFVLPSTSSAEGFGISMLQAMACGTPAISTELGTGTSWVNLNDTTGLVVPPRDPSALAAAINGLLADPARLEAMGHQAAERVQSTFSRACMLESLSSLYASV